MLFGLFVWNNNGELRRQAAISSLHRNSRITTILTVPEQQICVWLHCYYSYSETGMFGWVRNNIIDVVFGIEITIAEPNTNLLFRNSKNSCYSAIP
jgi:hypothetical protein